MQKLINLLAVISFSGFVGISAGGYYLYQNKDRIIQGLIPVPSLPGADSLPGVPSGTTTPGVPSAPSIPSIGL